jgi:hypothetical protein
MSRGYFLSDVAKHLRKRLLETPVRTTGCNSTTLGAWERQTQRPSLEKIMLRVGLLQVDHPDTGVPMRRYIIVGLAAALAACSSAHSSPLAPPSFNASGTWFASAGGNAESQTYCPTVTVTLAQTGNVLSGQWTDDDACAGTQTTRGGGLAVVFRGVPTHASQALSRAAINRRRSAAVRRPA